MTMNRFADYFVVVGLDVQSGLEPDKLSGDNLHCPPLERPYTSKVLAHYPENVPWNIFDKEAVGMLCHPKGLVFRTGRDSRNPRFHSFIITKEDGSRSHGAAFTFFEEVKNKQICAAMQTLHAMHLAELSNTQSRTLYAHMGPVYEHSPRMTRKPNLNELSRYYDVNRDTLFVTKSICILTQLPFVVASHNFLEQLYQAISIEKKTELPFESYIYNILYEVPLPPPGRCLSFYGIDQSVICQRPGVSELPLFEFSHRELFQLLGAENVINIFTSILLEHQILIFSQDYQRLMTVSEGITALIFPFSWQHVYVPILPASLIHFLDAPVPYIMGLHHNKAIDSALQLPSQASMCVVDIDANMVELPEELPQFPYQQELLEDLRGILMEFEVEVHNGLAKSDTNESLQRERGVGNGDVDSGMSSNAESTNSSMSSIPNKMEILQQSEALAKIAAIAKKTGVITSLDDLSERLNKENSNGTAKLEKQRATYTQDLVFNSAVRETFLNCFLQIFHAYEAFVIQPSSQDMESWLSNRESMQNFDKAAFLGDQRDTHLPFLSPFIETQMFTTLIDNKILSQWENPDPVLRVFEARLCLLRDMLGDNRTPAYMKCDSTKKESESLIEKRSSIIDLSADRPHELEIKHIYRHTPGFFPQLDSDILNKEPVTNKTKRDHAKWRRKDRLMQHSEHLQLNSDQREKYIQEARSKSTVRQPRLADMTSTAIAQTNWKFVATLLKECKTKTKRMLVEKMGQEAVELGHGEVSITGVEENTLIASLCDLLERIWSHGLQSKQGKSALWSHLLGFQEIEECNNTSKPIDPNFLTPDISSLALEAESPKKEKRHKRTGSKGPELPVLKPLPISLTNDMRNVQRMADIKTHVGYARAWVRLALEKKLLSTHMKELLADNELLRSLYKRYAFLRCEDEREQFLFYLLSLNAVDYTCFTNTFTNTMIPYRVLIFPTRKFGGGTTSANCWISIAGTLGDTGKIELPKHTWELTFEHKNLGMLTTMRIGHDNSGMMPKWMVEHTLVRNEVSGHTFRFPCGRWLGRGIDDGSIERLLVAEIVPSSTDTDDLMSTCSTPPRCRSPSTPRKSESRMRVSEIQQMLGSAVNNIVKHFYKPEKERGSLTVLLCGEQGLVFCMESLFEYGFKSSRLFRNRFYIWDFLEKVLTFFETILGDDAGENKLSETLQATCRTFIYVINKINAASATVGKDGRFQLFICIGVRDHLLQRWIDVMSKIPITASMYEEKAFLRDPKLVSYLMELLDTLKEFNITLEASIIKGVDI